MTRSQLPILIFKGDSSLCFGILEQFSARLRDALTDAGEDVIYLNPEEDSLDNYVGKKYKAIIGFLETVFYATYPESGENVFDSFYGPKFNFWFDHPAFYHDHVKRAPSNYHILTHDRNYVRFIEKYYPNIKAHFFPPGGVKAETIIPYEERKYTLSFVGTYLNWTETIKQVDISDDRKALIVDKYLDKLATNPWLTADEAYKKVLTEIGENPNREEFLEGLAGVLVLASYGVSRAYRQEIVQHIVEEGFSIDVFGDGWDRCPYSDNPNLHIHEKLPFGSANEVYRNSKMSLNIMTWHKDSITERVLDIMLSGCIAVSDFTESLSDAFEPGKEILLFHLDKFHEISEILRNNQNAKDIAEAGYKKASLEYTWDRRAQRLLEMLETEMR